MPSNEIDKNVWGGAVEFDSLLADIRSRRQEFEDQKYISQDIIERFKKIGVYRALVPKRFGGDEKSPNGISADGGSDFGCRRISRLGSELWYEPGLSASLPVETIDKVWKETPDVVFAGGIFPAAAC